MTWIARLTAPLRTLHRRRLERDSLARLLRRTDDLVLRDIGLDRVEVEQMLILPDHAVSEADAADRPRRRGRHPGTSDRATRAAA